MKSFDHQLPLIIEEDFDNYLQLLEKYKSDLIIAVCVKDTPGNKLNDKTISFVKKLGFSNFNNNLWTSYSGLLVNGKIKIDESTNSESDFIEKDFKKGKLKIKLLSSSWKSGNKASIVINGVEYADNNRGINIVVFNSSTVFDSISIDRHIFPNASIVHNFSKINLPDSFYLISKNKQEDLKNLCYSLILENNFENYIDYLYRFYKHGYTIVFAVKDTAGNQFSKVCINKLHEIGLSKFDNKLWHPYIAVVHNGVVCENHFGYDENSTLSFEDILDGVSFKIKSSTYNVENIASIRIDGFEYACNIRGLNIVVYDNVKGLVIDSCDYDGHMDSRTPLFHNFKKSKYFEGDPFIASLLVSFELNKKTNDLLNNISNIINYENRANNQKYLSLYKTILNIDDDEQVLRSFYENLPKAKSSLRIVQLLLTNLLSDFHLICEKEGLRYWLCFGGLIGAERHKGFVPWDDDIDVCMMRSEFSKFRKVIKKYDSILLVERFDRQPDGMIHVMRIYYKNFPSYFIDIFTFDYSQNNSEFFGNEILKFRKMFRNGFDKFNSSNSLDEYVNECDTLCDECAKAINQEKKKEFVYWSIENFSIDFTHKKKDLFFNISDIFPLKLMSFEGKQFYGPNRPEKVLSDYYGDIFGKLPYDVDIQRHIKLNKKDEENIKIFLNLK